MTDISDINWNAMNDKAVSEILGGFIKESRLRQRKTQEELAAEAGIARSTLSLLEKGKNTSLLAFIRLLRALGMLSLLEEFRERERLTPLQLAKIEHKKMKRVRHGIKTS
jgi:transcriptional regulator with XRE-family HTH domain